MDRAVTFTKFIQPIGLPSMTDDVFNAKGFVVGHGAINVQTKKNSETPKQVEMTSVDNEKCLLSNPISNLVASNRSFCAMGNHSAPCTGRSSTYLFTKP